MVKKHYLRDVALSDTRTGMNLRINLLGTPSITLQDQQSIQPRLAKAMALLAFLTVERQTHHARSTLAGLLWADRSEQDARRNLTQTLTRIRKLIGDNNPQSAYFETTRSAIWMRADAPIWCDAGAFSQLIAATKRHAHDSVSDCDDCQQQLGAAVALVRGEWMAGFELANAEPFEAWRRVQQEQLHATRLNALFELGEGGLRREAWGAVQQVAREQIQLEPWREKAHRQLMEALARDGQRDAAIEQFARCRERLQQEMGIDVSAETRTLYTQICNDTLTNEVARPKITVTLPASTTPFIGRAVELEKMVEHVLTGGYRLVTVLGQGGIGKTRLALEIGQRVAQHGGNLAEVHFVGLARIDSAENIPQAIASALNLTLRGNQSAADQVLQRLQRRHALLILDNFEQLVDEHQATDFVVRLLAEAPTVRLLVTSRAELGLLSEDIFELHGLHAPAADADCETLEQFDAVRLFLDRARRLDKGFQLSAETTPAVIDICTLVAGMPLGIELATSWLRRKSVNDIAHGMAHSLDYVTTHLRDIKPQHRSLRAVFDYSWALLTAEERDLLGWLSVFRGGFAVAAVAAVTPHTAAVVEQLLDQLRSKSLVKLVAAGRYDLHEVVRQFSAETLPDPKTPHAMHSRHYLQWVADHTDALFGASPAAAVQEIERDLDNVRLAWRRGKGQLRETCARALERFLTMRGYFEEAELLFSLAVDVVAIRPILAQVLTIRGRSDLATEHARAALADPQADPRTIVRARTVLAEIAMGQGDPTTETQLQETLQLAERHQLATEQIQLLNDLTFATSLRGQHAAARQFAERGLSLARLQNDSVLQHKLLTSVAVCALEIGDLRAGRAYVEEGLQIAERTQDRGYRSRAANMIGWMARRTGDYATALVQHARSAEIAAAMGESVQLTHAWFNLAVAHLRLDNYDDAADYAERIITLAREIAAVEPETMGLSVLAMARHAQGQSEVAEQFCREAIVLWQKIGQAANLTEMEIWLADIALAVGKTAVAARLVEKSAEFVLHNSCDGMISPVFAQRKLLLLVQRQGLPCFEKLKLKYDNDCGSIIAQIDDLSLRQAFIERIAI